MTPAAHVQSVITILDEIFASPKPADSVISAHFRHNRYIGSKDRKQITRQLYRVLRHYHRLSWHTPYATTRYMVLADICLLGRQDPAEFFGQEQYGPTPMTKNEQAFVYSLEGKHITDKKMPQHIQLECPTWAVPSLEKALGDQFVPVMEAMRSEAPLDLRVNTEKTDRDTLREALQFPAENTPYSPWCLRVTGSRPALGQNDLFNKGQFEVQDEGSQMIALAANPSKRNRVLDFCAGAGGKTLALGAMMKNKGQIMAIDVSEGRLKRAKQRFRRADLHNVTTRAIKSETDPWLKRHRGKYDIVLVDAPCSGTGTWRRDPDKKWRSIGPKLDELLDLQKRILDSAVRMVKPGGRLIYATCSLLCEENNDQFQAFLERHDDISALDMSKEEQLSHLKLTTPYMQLNPSEHKTDGFFCAIAVRNKKDNDK